MPVFAKHLHQLMQSCVWTLRVWFSRVGKKVWWQNLGQRCRCIDLSTSSRQYVYVARVRADTYRHMRVHASTIVCLLQLFVNAQHRESGFWLGKYERWEHPEATKHFMLNNTDEPDHWSSTVIKGTHAAIHDSMYERCSQLVAPIGRPFECSLGPWFVQP